MKPKRLLILSATLLISFCVCSETRADKSLEGVACRSVHLWWKAPEGDAFYNEITIDKSADGTYFMVCGFNMGYFGIQELADGRKVVLFSVWDPGNQNDPKSVKEERQVRVLHEGEDVLVKRFGGEGTGGQSFFNYDWKNGETYRFLVRAKKDGDRTAFSGYFYIPEKKEWKHLVTFSTLAGGGLLKGYYSFVEDFRRNKISATKTREARFGNGWVRTGDTEWHSLTEATFTADRNPVVNIDSGYDKSRFTLRTGGEIENSTVKLNGKMKADDTSAWKINDDVKALFE